MIKAQIYDEDSNPEGLIPGPFEDLISNGEADQKLAMDCIFNMEKQWDKRLKKTEDKLRAEMIIQFEKASMKPFVELD